MPHKTYFNWSTGKDSALALHLLLSDPRYQVTSLLTAVNEHFSRVSIHGLREELLDLQVAATGLPVCKVLLPQVVSNSDYERRLGDAVAALKAEGYTHAAFGDIFLEDLRSYREQQLASWGVEAVFPLWKGDTADLARRFIASGFRAVTVSVDAAKLGAGFAGRLFDESFLKDLPPDVDPCGENGEFHSFCFDGPVFHQPVPFGIGEKVYREYALGNGQHAGFWYCDLLPG